MSDPITSIFNCQTAALKTPTIPDFSLPAIDVPGFKNLIASAISSVIVELTGIIEFIKKYTKNPLKIANILTDLPKLPEKIIKEFVDAFLAKLKLPDFAKIIRDTIDAVVSKTTQFTLPTIDFAIILVNTLKGLLTGKDPLAALAAALEPIKAAIASAASEVQNVVEMITQWIEKYVKLILALVSIPLFILKSVIDFITKSFKDLVSGFVGLINFVVKSLKDLVFSLLKSLGLLPEPGFMSPVIQLFICLIEQVIAIIKGIPGNLAGLASLVA